MARSFMDSAPKESAILHIPPHLQRFVAPRPPPFYTPLSARWQHSYAYVTLAVRLGTILDTTLDQFRIDMKEILEEEERIAAKEGLERCEEGECNKVTVLTNNENVMSGTHDFNIEGFEVDISVNEIIIWLFSSPDMSYYFPDNETSEMSVEMKRCIFKAAGLKLDRSIPPKVKSERNVCPTKRKKYENVKEKCENKPIKCDASPPKNNKPQGLTTHCENEQKINDNCKEIPPCHPDYVKKEPMKELPDEEEYILVDDPRFDEWNNVEKALMELKQEISQNMWLKNFHSNAPDIAGWNRFLKERAKEEKTLKLRWICTVWMYSESYFFRRLHEIFETTKSLRYYDPFRKMKEKSFHKFVPGMDKVANDFFKIIGISPLPKPKHERTAKFLKMFLTMSLWGNRPDLMKGGPTSVASDFTQGNPLLRSLTFACSILVDQMDEVWTTLTNEELNANRRVDIVTDNAGFELFADMILADFLLTFRLADRVHFHVKAMPWFISGATRYDLYRMIEMMAENRKKSVPLAKMAERWFDFIACGQWVVEDDHYWTMPFGYEEMRCQDGPLYAKLSRSSLVIFKGDLNYRKLLGDVNWEPSVRFKTALRSFRPTNLVALRTFKSDLICGVPLSSAIFAQVPKGWMLHGSFAVAQYAKRRKSVPGLPGPP